MTKEEVRNKIQNAIGVHDDLLTMVKKWKLRWYGRISRSSGMAKTILQGTVKGAFGLVWFDLFYGPSTHFRSFWARPVYVATLFLGKPPRQFTST